METTWRVISREGEGVKWGKKVQAIRSINGRYKMDRGRVRIVQEMEKPKTFYARTTHGQELRAVENAGGRGGTGRRGIKGRKKMEQLY